MQRLKSHIPKIHEKFDTVTNHLDGPQYKYMNSSTSFCTYNTCFRINPFIKNIDHLGIMSKIQVHQIDIFSIFLFIIMNVLQNV